ncbi:MAG: filamentous hemagglutinin N-terminal domain-containing protein, partial [Rhodospirillales bacterium]|nr:filamentous hemagglutinin N-terminal domain-containing protein [Rhodospirillales bacterium]
MRHGKRASSPQTIVRLPQNPRSTPGPVGGAVVRRASRDLLCSTALSSAAAAVVLGAAGGALANPAGGEVVAGSARISTTPKTVTIDQASDRAVINWNTFSIEPGETTRFNQPGPSSITLNRVLSPEASRIAGTLSANGQIVITNGAGVIFTPTAQLNVGGITATTAGMSSAAQAQFMSGAAPTFDIAAKPGSAVVNEGRITVAEGGYAAFVAPTVRNSGVIEAKLGKVTLAGAEKFTLDLYGDDLVKIAVPEAAASELRKVENSGSIEGTTVALTVDAVKGLVDGLINVSGTVQARRATMEGGKIVLRGGGGTVEVAGKLDAAGTGAGTKGGAVEITGDKVALAGTATVDASGEAGGGTVLVGGGWQGKGPQQKASQTVMATGAKIKADAKKSGDGGTVVLWSEEVTRVGGEISAKGGARGGNGGKVETSGKKKLVVAESTVVDTSAANGKTGTWLLDPADIEIKDVPTSTEITFDTGTSAFEPDPGAGASVLARDLLQEQLALTNVVVTTTNSGADGAGNGDIKVTDDVTWTSGTSLSLIAARDILIEASIDGGAGGLTLEAGRHIDDGVNGQISIGTLTANAGGSITLDNPDHLIGTLGPITGTGVVINDSEGGLRIAGAIDGRTGNVSILTGGGTLDVDATVRGADVRLATTDSGDIALDAAVTATGTLALDAAGNVTQTVSFSAGTLKGTVAGSATLDNPANDVGSLGDFETGTGFALADASGLEVVGAVRNTSSGTLSLSTTGGDLAITGAIEGQDVALAASGGTSGIALDGTVSASGTLTLAAAGDVTQSAALSAGTLEGTVGGSATLDNSANAIATLGAFSTGSGLTLVDSSGGLTVAGTVSAATGNIDIGTAGGALALGAGGTVTGADIRLASTGGGIALGGTVSATGTLTLAAAGDITQTAAITAGTLAAATTSGAIRLDTASNDVAALGAITAVGGGFYFDNGNNDLTLTATVQTRKDGGAPISIDVGTGALDTAGNAIETREATTTNIAAGAVSLTADTIDLGTVADRIRTTGTVTLRPTTPTRSIGVAGGAGDFNLSAGELEAIADGAASIVIGRSKDDGGAHQIVIGGGAPVAFRDAMVFNAAASGGGITVAAGSPISSTGSLTFNGSGAGTTLNADVVTAGAKITIDDAVVLGADVRLDTTNGGAAVAGADVTISGTTTGNGNDLTIAAGSAGAVSLTNVAGVGTLRLASSAGATFGAVNAGAVALDDTTGTIAFNGAVTIGTLATANKGYSVAFNAGGTITNAATFLNTGRVTFGNENTDSITFAAGLDTTGGPAETVVQGTVATASAPLRLGAVKANGTTTLDAGTGSIEVGAVTLADGAALTFRTSGAGAVTAASISGTANGAKSDVTFDAGGAVSVAGNVGTDIGTLRVANSGGTTFGGTVDAATVALDDTTGTIAFNGAVTIGTLATANKGYSVAFNAGGTITNAATFLNTGRVTFGNENTDSITFAAGLDTTGGPAETVVQGTVATASAPLRLGAVKANGTTTLDAGTGSIEVGAVTLADGAALTFRTSGAGAVTAASISGTANGAKSDVTFDAGGAVSVAGNVGTDIGTLRVANSGGTTFGGTVDAATVALDDTTGTIAFNGAVTIGTLTTANKDYSVAFNAGGTIANATTFLNTGTVTLGNDGSDSILFKGGLDTVSGASRPSLVRIAGTVATENAALTLGDALNGSVMLMADATLDAGTGTVSLRNLAAGAHDLTVTADEIELLGGADAVSGTGALLLQPKTAQQDIEIAGPGGTAALDLTAAEFASLRNGFSNITIGRPDGAGTIRVAGPVVFGDPVTLRAPGAGGRIVVDAQLAGADGASITLDGFDPTVLGASIVTAGGSIGIGGSVVLDGDVTLDTTGGGAVGGADIVIGGTVEGSGDGTEDLTLRAGSGDISVGGAVGGANRLGALTIASGDAVAFQGTVSAVSLEIANSTSTGFARKVDLTGGAGAAAGGGDIAFGGGLVAGGDSIFLNTGRLTLAGATIGGALAHTVGPSTISGPIAASSIDFGAVELTGATSLETVLGGNVTLGAVSGPHSLVVKSAGTTTFGGTVSVAELATDAGGTTVIAGGAVTTSGGQTYGDDVSLGADTVLRSTGAGDIDLGPSVTGAHALTIDTAGTTVLRDLDVGSLETKGGGTTSLSGSVTTIGGQTYREDVAVDGDSILTSTGAGEIAFAGTVGSAGAKSLAVDTGGITRFAGAVGGGGRALGSLLTGGGTTVLDGGSVTTTGDQIYADSLTLGANTVLTSTGGGTIALAAVSGARRLDVHTAGTTRFGGAVSVAELTTDAGGTTEVAGGTIITSGRQTYGDDVSLGADAVLTSTGAGDIDLGPSVTGTHALTIDTAGTTVLRDLDVGSLETKGGGTTSLSGSVTTTGGQAYGEDVTVDGDSVLTSTGGGEIAFAGTVGSAGAKSLAVDTGGITRFAGAVGGGGRALGSLLTGGGGTTVLDGGSVTTTGDQIYADSLTLGANTVLTSTGGGTIALAAVNGA